MGVPFSDITLYAPTPHPVGTIEYWEDTSLQNFVSDFYVQKMYGYKPSKASRVSIQPEFHNIWNRTWKFGSIFSIAPYYNYDDFKVLDKRGKYRYILEIIHTSMLQLSNEYHWDKTVFENAYQEIIKTDFKFKIEYPAKVSRDKKKVAKLIIEKTETLTSLYLDITIKGVVAPKIKLFDKKNTWWYDCTYILLRHNKWLDIDRFGISYKGVIEIWYSIEENEITFYENKSRVTEIDFKKFFLFN